MGRFAQTCPPTTTAFLFNNIDSLLIFCSELARAQTGAHHHFSTIYYATYDARIALLYMHLLNYILGILKTPTDIHYRSFYNGIRKIFAVQSG